MGPGKKECYVLTNSLYLSFCSSESSPEPRFPSNRLPVLPAFQPLYPSDHVSLRVWYSWWQVPCLWLFSFLWFPIYLFSIGKSVAQYTASLCLWVPLPFPRLPFHGPFSPFCGPSYPEGVDVDSVGIGAIFRLQEELLPRAPSGMDSAEQSQ